MFTVPHFELWTSRFHDHLSNTLFVFLFLKDSADVWTPWSRCRRCVQSRERACDEPSRCGAVIRELRPCPGRRCSLKMRPSKPKTPGFRVLHHLQSLVYSDWSRWSPCTSECRTRRQRVCKMPMICGKTLVHEDALCYVRGTACETRYADTAGKFYPRFVVALQNSTGHFALSKGPLYTWEVLSFASRAPRIGGELIPEISLQNCNVWIVSKLSQNLKVAHSYL